MRYQCGKHAGECSTATTPEGTFCTASGVEVAGPALVCYDFRHCCNTLSSKLSARTKVRRKTASLASARRRHMSAGSYNLALTMLYGDHPQWHLLATALKNWSELLQIERTTVAASRAWASIFTATVTSKLAHGEVARGGILLPKVPFFHERKLTAVQYRERGVVCRSMSSMWHRIKAAAMAENGTVDKPFRMPVAF